MNGKKTYKNKNYFYVMVVYGNFYSSSDELFSSSSSCLCLL